MENNAQIMEYTQEFRDFLAIAKKCEQTYVGYGNPNADILIIANEPGVKEDLFVEKDLNRNLDLWNSNLPGKSMDSVEDMLYGDVLHWDAFNPLWPVKGQHFTIGKEYRHTSRSWLQCQKLVDMIYSEHHECNRQKDDSLDFFERAFITDFSAVYGKSSKEIDPEKRCESIIQRLPLFGSSFISRFPVLIVASGHYIRDIEPLHDLRKVFHGFNKVEMVYDAFGWRNIHYSEDGKRVLIHSMHFASAISDDYLRAIAKVSSPYIKK